MSSSSSASEAGLAHSAKLVSRVSLLFIDCNEIAINYEVRGKPNNLGRTISRQGRSDAAIVRQGKPDNRLNGARYAAALCCWRNQSFRASR